MPVLTCEWRSEHDHVTDTPVGPPCGALATRIILWLDGTQRWSPACERHLDLDHDAPPHVIIPRPWGRPGR
jgi:hypothetical protein